MPHSCCRGLLGKHRQAGTVGRQEIALFGIKRNVCTAPPRATMLPLRRWASTSHFLPPTTDFPPIPIKAFQISELSGQKIYQYSRAGCFLGAFPSSWAGCYLEWSILSPLWQPVTAAPVATASSGTSPGTSLPLFGFPGHSQELLCPKGASQQNKFWD